MDDVYDGDGDDEVNRAARILDALGDSVARRALLLGLDGPVTADDVASAADVSRSTVYRRFDALVDLDLMREATGPRSRPSSGTRYRTRVDRIWVALDASGIDIETGGGTGEDQLEAAVHTLLRALDVTEAVFDVDEGTIRVTLNGDSETTRRVLDYYRDHYDQILPPSADETPPDESPPDESPDDDR